MIELVASLLALGAGPVLVRLAGARRVFLAGLDGFALVAVGGLMALHVLPHAIERAGAWAAVAALCGFVAPGALERRLVGVGGGNRLLVLVALAGLGFHAFLDGAALADSGHGRVEALLALGVILHRVPDGLAIWLLARPGLGARRAVALLGLVGAATVVGFALGDAGLRALPLDALAGFQAFVAGSLLHILLHHPTGAPLDAGGDGGHHHRHDVPDAHGHLGSGLGALGAVGLLWALDRTHAEAHGLGEHLAERVVAVAPWLLVAFALSALLWGGRHSRLAASARDGALRQWARGLAGGLTRSGSPGGALPEYRELARVGVAPVTALATLGAAVALCWEGVLVSIAVLGPAVGGARAAAAVVVGAAAALLAGALARVPAGRSGPAAHGHAAHAAHGHAPEAAHGHADATADVRAGRGGRLAALMATVEHTTPWIVLGLCGAALLEEHLPAGSLAAAAGPLPIAIAALAGALVWVSVAGAAPLAGVVVAAGLSPGAAVAFLVASPAGGTAVLRGIAGTHGRPAAWAWIATIVAAAIGAGTLVDALLPSTAAPALAIPPAVGATAGVVLAALGVFALLRRGPRGLVEQVLHAPDEPDE